MTPYRANKAQVAKLLVGLESQASLPAKGYKTVIQRPPLEVITIINRPHKAHPKLPYLVTVENWPAR